MYFVSSCQWSWA